MDEDEDEGECQEGLYKEVDLCCTRNGQSKMNICAHK